MWQVWKTGELLTGLWWGDLTEKGPLENLIVDGRIVFKWICIKLDLEEVGWGGLDWIDLAQDRDRCERL